MGFTRYWERPGILSSRKFRAVSRDCQKAIEYLARNHGIRVQFDDDNSLPAEFGTDRIQFNGPGKDGHETFKIERVFNPVHPEKRPAASGLWFDFCKTERKPYDAAVCICMVVQWHHFGEQFVISSDGYDEEGGLPLAQQVCQQVLGYGADFSQLTTAFQRLPLQGLPYITEIRESNEKCYRLSNGWLIVRKSRGVTVEMPYGEQRLIASARSLTEARWSATIAYLNRTLLHALEKKPAVSIAPFMADAKGTLHNWTPLAVLADALEEKADRRYRILRAVIPKVF